MKKYLVDVYHEVREDHWSDHKMETDSPKEAIEEWVKLSIEFPTCASINCSRKADAMELMTYVHDNESWFFELCTQDHGFPYIYGYLMDAVETNIRLECLTFHEYCHNGVYYRDMVHPFDIG